MKNTDFSVIIPAYEPTEEQLMATLGSVSLNAACSFEAIVVDDGNTPQVRELIYKVCAYYPEVLVLSLEGHTGMPAARNYGCAHAKGNYVTFLEAGDQLEPGILDHVLVQLRRRKPKVLIGRIAKGKKGGFQEATPIQVLPDTVLPIGPMAGFPLERVRIYLLTLHDKAFADASGQMDRSIHGRFLDRGFALEVPFQENLPFGEDVLWNLDILSLTTQVLLYPVPCYRYAGDPPILMGEHPQFPLELDTFLLAIRREIATWPERDRVYYYNFCLDYFPALCRTYVFRPGDGQEKERFLQEVQSSFWRRVFHRADEKALRSSQRLFTGLGKRRMDGALYQLCKSRYRE